tara:strand:- start:75 stop:1298 length:1224 start_codon:yes stop_codon:yes gene_type:complete
MMDFENFVASIVQEKFKEFDEAAAAAREKEGIAQVGLGTRPMSDRPGLAKEDDEIKVEKLSTATRVLSDMSDYYQPDEFPTQEVRIDNAPRFSSINKATVLDILSANRDGLEKQGIIKMPMGMMRQPDPTLDIDGLQSRILDKLDLRPPEGSVQDIQYGLSAQQLGKVEDADTDIDVDRDAPVGEAPTGLMSPSSFSPIEEAIKEKTNNFYLNIAKNAEGDHGDIPRATNDSREANKPIKKRSKDVGYGHKVKPDEESSGLIHGIKFKNEDGTYIPLTEEQKIKILNADMSNELRLARESGWDKKLEAIGTRWEDLDFKYQNALNSLAYNVGGPKAAKQWTKVLTAAKDKNIKDFAKEMRRKDNKKYTAGMDNRVVKELYYAGIINNFSEVSSVLPLATADGSGVPE